MIENSSNYKKFQISTIADGQYLKLLNDYSMFRTGAVHKMIDEIKKHSISKSVISWSNGETSNYNGTNINEFMKILGINSTWSTCFGIWREQFEAYKKT